MWTQKRINRECGHDLKFAEFYKIVPDDKTDSFWEIWDCTICHGMTMIELQQGA